MFKRTLPLLTLLFVACGSSGDPFQNFCVDVNCGARGYCAVGAEGPFCICDQGLQSKMDFAKNPRLTTPVRDHLWGVWQLCCSPR